MGLNQSFISDVSEYYRWSQKTKIKYKLQVDFPAYALSKQTPLKKQKC